MIPALAAALILVAVYVIGLLMGRLMRNKLEKTAFFSGLLGFSVSTVTPLIILNEFSIGGAEQLFRITPGILAVAVIVVTWAISCVCAVALALKHRAPNKSFKPTPLRGAA